MVDHRRAGRPVAAHDVEHAGRQDLGGSSPSRTVEAGVVSDGLSTNVLPAASAGPIFQTAIIIG